MKYKLVPPKNDGYLQQHDKSSKYYVKWNKSCTKWSILHVCAHMQKPKSLFYNQMMISRGWEEWGK